VTFDDYATAAARTENHRLSEGERLMDAAAGLAEEGGEVLSLVRKHVYQGHILDKERVAKELGDALWCLATVASSVGISLDDVARTNVEKLRLRYPDGYSDQASQDRLR
jgi:NTP pyrophosphatase (non-canonical NTP hydrolase)